MVPISFDTGSFGRLGRRVDRDRQGVEVPLVHIDCCSGKGLEGGPGFSFRDER
jgi:hypothetical protein